MPVARELIVSALLAFMGLMVLLVTIPVSLLLAFLETAKGLFVRTRPFQPRNILVTGASSGIGAAMAMEYSEQGRHVILVGRNQERLEEVRKACEIRGADVQVLSVDIGNKDAVIRAFADLDKDHPIDLVIANAGMVADRSSITMEKLGLEGVATALVSTNVLGIFYTLAPILEGMKKRQRGQVAVTGSVVGLFGAPNIAIYASTKALLHSFSRDLHFALKARYGVHLSLIAPGFVDSHATEIMRNDGKSWFPLFLHWSPQEASRFIRSKLEGGQYYIAFPFYMFALEYCASILPPSVQPYLSALIGYTGVTGSASRDILCMT